MDPTARFTELVQGPQDRIPLDEAALLIAAHAHPGLDVAAGLALLDDLAAGIRPPTVESWRRHVFTSLGFSGNVANYYDPANSFLDDVLRRRVGLPITLSVLGMELARRAGLALRGVAMPGHFLLRYDGGDKASGTGASGPVFVDAFAGGRVLDRAGCLERFRAVNGNAPFLADYLEPVGPRVILARMLANLKSIYAGRGNVAGLTWVFALRLALPDALPTERREWARVLGASGRFVEAAVELEDLVDALPEREEELLTEAFAFRARLN